MLFPQRNLAGFNEKRENMGIALNALVIALGGLVGSMLSKGIAKENFRTLGISIVIVSFVGFFENVYHIEGGKLVSESLVLVLVAFIVGSKLGDVLHLEDKLSNVGMTANASHNAVLDAFLYFGIGGLQILGPIALATQNDNSQLILKSIIDIPFSIVFGATYGRKVAWAAIPVAAVQVVIFLVASVFRSFFTSQIIMEVCAMGFIILFFSGFNLVSDGKNKISNINMLPGVFIMLVISGLKEWVF